MVSVKKSLCLLCKSHETINPDGVCRFCKAKGNTSKKGSALSSSIRDEALRDQAATPEKLEPAEAYSRIKHAVEYIASRCDGAITDDGMGFNGSDSSFGRNLARLSIEDWDDNIAFEARAMLKKYKGQLAGGGIDYDSLPKFPTPDDYVSEIRYTAKRRIAAREAIKSRKVLVGNGTFIVQFEYDPRLVQGVKGLPGRKFVFETKNWTLPFSSQEELIAWAEEEQFSIDPAVYKYEPPKVSEKEKIEAANAEIQRRTGVIDKNKMIFDISYEDRVGREAFKNIPYRKFDGKTKTWSVPIKHFKEIETWASEYGYFLPSGFIEEQDRLAKLKEERQKVLEGLSEALETDFEMPDTLGISLFAHQKVGVEYAMTAKRTLIADDVGLGKTAMSLAILEADNAYPAIIVVPNVVKLNWRNEARLVLPHRTISVLNGTEPGAQGDLSDSDIIILNYDILPKRLEELQDLEKHGLIYDEAHLMKNRKAVRSIAGKELAKTINEEDQLLTLSGTPMTGRRKELWAQIELLGLQDEFGGTFTNYALRYCDGYYEDIVIQGGEVKTVLIADGKSNSEELHEKLRANGMLRRRKDQALKDLPPKTRVILPVEMDGPEWKEYHEIKKNLMDFIEEHAGVDAIKNGENPITIIQEKLDAAERAEALVRMSKLRDASSLAKRDLAVDWAQNFLESTDEKLVVFARSIETQEYLAEKLGALKITASVSSDERIKAKEAFQNDPSERVIVCSVKIATVGITLTAASTMLVADEVEFTPDIRDQVEGRIHRLTQDVPSTIHYLMGDDADSIDNYMLDIIEDKAVDFNEVMDKGEAPEVKTIRG